MEEKKEFVFTDKDKTKIWKTFCETDPTRTKDFNKGFKGTAINPTYIKERLTNFFGPVGLGWGYKIVDEEIIKGHKEGENQTMIHKVLIEFWYIFGGLKSEPLQAFGQTTFVGTNKNGWFTDEEAPKKSLTDALTKATSDLGMCADIHGGKWDGCKYTDGQKPKDQSTNESNGQSGSGGKDAKGKMATTKQANYIKKLFREAQFDPDNVINYLLGKYAVDQAEALTSQEASALIGDLQNGTVNFEGKSEEKEDIPF